MNEVNYQDYSTYCYNRLPCGYCRLMSAMCPLQIKTETTWGTSIPINSCDTNKE